jgi:hypothetical protein
MQGFNLAQLTQALQDFPVYKSDLYLANLNRLIFLGELRLIRDLDLDIFDVNDNVTVAPGAVAIPKPPQSAPLTFAAVINVGAVSGTLAANWTQATGVYVVTFSDNEIQAVTLTQGATTATWPIPMAANVTVNARVNSQFVVERDLWLVLTSGAVRILRKRSYSFVQMYQSAAAGVPKYYADQGNAQVQWVIAPATDATVASCNRRYVQRPPSIVAMGNTYLGDNFGDVLFVACLMESEHFVKADDRYADFQKKYYGELLPNARGEVSLAARSGVYSPLEPTAAVQGPPQAPEAQG